MDSRRAPRGSPPFASVLRALQDGRRCTVGGSIGRDNCGSDDVASLGLLTLGSTCFLVNRRLLRTRLAQILAPPTTARAKRETELLDVRRYQRTPTLCTEHLAPRLVAALSWIFGDVKADDTPSGARVNASDVCGEENAAKTTAPSTSESQETSESDGLCAPGGRWLEDWESTTLTLDVGHSLCTTLGNVGMSGLAGWLLEYPVVYCCRASGSRDDDNGGDSGNCLAMTCLTVYTIGLRFEEPNVPASTPPSSDELFGAFSFSIPEVVHTGAEGNGCSADEEMGEQGHAAPGYFSGVVDRFVARLENRVARCGAVSSTHCRLPSSARLVVERRTEILDHVAL